MNSLNLRKSSPNGTPKTLKLAIAEGLAMAIEDPATSPATQLQIVESNVLDYFRQKFTVAYYLAETLAQKSGDDTCFRILQDLAKKTGVDRTEASNQKRETNE